MHLDLTDLGDCGDVVASLRECTVTVDGRPLPGPQRWYGIAPGDASGFTFNITTVLNADAIERLTVPYLAASDPAYRDRLPEYEPEEFFCD